MKIKNIKLVKMGNSQGFYIPSSFLSDKIHGGLETNQTYDLHITEHDPGDVGDEPEVGEVEV